MKEILINFELYFYSYEFSNFWDFSGFFSEFLYFLMNFKDFLELKINFSNLKLIFQIIYSAQSGASDQSRSMIKGAIRRGATWNIRSRD